MRLHCIKKAGIFHGHHQYPVCRRRRRDCCPGGRAINQACLRPRDRFWDIPVPKIDSAFDNLLVPQQSWSPSTTQQPRKLVAAPYLAPI
ncbi:hypothetical protein [Thiolapillus sp.]|uniref:hypothetical protein n=4 Tax=Thiolapillus sp. TaxID=2017437 RepID=UPI0025D9CEEC|nr:hypothetical protein [Thiolapillus sp.]